MHKKGILLLALIAVIFLFLGPSFAQPTIQKAPAPAPLPQRQTIQQPTIKSDQKISSFSADLIMLNPQGVVKRQIKIYVTPSKILMNNVLQRSGAPIAMIFRRDSNVRWMLNSANKTYVVKPLNESELIAFNRENIKARREKILATEIVSGFECSIKTVETTASFNESTRQIISTIWVSPRLDIPIRTKSQDGSITELRNVKAGPLQPALFDLPAGYKRVSTVKDSWGHK